MSPLGEPRCVEGALAGLRAASGPAHRTQARLLTVDADGELGVCARDAWTEQLRAGDLVIANDAATLPASLRATHTPSGRTLELRLAGRATLSPDDLVFDALLLGEGDHTTPTERRRPAPRVEPGEVLSIDRSTLGLPPLLVGVLVRHHRRLVRVSFGADPRAFWSMLAQLGRAVQYAHVPAPLALWDAWTRLAGPPVAFEPPSAGFVWDWSDLERLRERGAGFATLTHAAGLSSTGDAGLDARLPFEEAYALPSTTAERIALARASGGRVVAIGTSVVRALEHAASRGPIEQARHDRADQRIGPHTTLAVVDVIVSGVHAPGSSHHQLLRAFTGDDVLARAERVLVERGFFTHEFGDFVWLEAARRVR